MTDSLPALPVSTNQTFRKGMKETLALGNVGEGSVRRTSGNGLGVSLVSCLSLVSI